jgi:hypothetical protein
MSAHRIRHEQAEASPPSEQRRRRSGAKRHAWSDKVTHGGGQDDAFARKVTHSREKRRNPAEKVTESGVFTQDTLYILNFVARSGGGMTNPATGDSGAR